MCERHIVLLNLLNMVLHFIISYFMTKDDLESYILDSNWSHDMCILSECE